MPSWGSDSVNKLISISISISIAFYQLKRESYDTMTSLSIARFSCLTCS
ncbi:hypothetical protein BAZMOX_86593_0 [methanotrophic endosymbiont of Bathymodiolus azoricus (Menez Gwen)]|nr:hypothetical protein BAZMOX_86593_0 [methanotrophic endosymbiont of Bathymodiolus azoricus (Menez Gwen)]